MHDCPAIHPNNWSKLRKCIIMYSQRYFLHGHTEDTLPTHYLVSLFSHSAFFIFFLCLIVPLPPTHFPYCILFSKLFFLIMTKHHCCSDEKHIRSKKRKSPKPPSRFSYGQRHTEEKGHCIGRIYNRTTPGWDEEYDTKYKGNNGVGRLKK